MADDTNSWRAIKRWGAIIVCAFYLGLTIPRNIAAEKNGTRSEGVVVGYQTSFSGRYFYPIVRIAGRDRELDLKSTESWYWKWCDVGEQVPVLRQGRTCLVGSPLRRWSGVLVFGGMLVVLSIWSFRRVPNQ